VKQIQSFFLQCTFPLLLAFTGLADVSLSLFAAETTEQEQMISPESLSDNVESLLYLNNTGGSDGDDGTDACFFNQPTLFGYLLPAKEEQNNIHSSRHSFIALYLLYHSLIFYHPIAYT
jgi:hypothetical protein